MKKNKEKQCPDCDGDGFLIYSCCGDDMKLLLPESDICPTCREHTGGMDDKEQCEMCQGTGSILIDKDERPKAKEKKNETIL